MEEVADQFDQQRGEHARQKTVADEAEGLEEGAESAIKDVNCWAFCHYSWFIFIFVVNFIIYNFSFISTFMMYSFIVI